MEYLDYFLYYLDVILEIYNTKKSILSLSLMFLSSLVTLLVFEVNNIRLKNQIRDLKKENEELASKVFNYELRSENRFPMILP